MVGHYHAHHLIKTILFHKKVRTAVEVRPQIHGGAMEKQNKTKTTKNIIMEQEDTHRII